MAVAGTTNNKVRFETAKLPGNLAHNHIGFTSEAPPISMPIKVAQA